MGKTAIVIMLLTVIAKSFGFIRDIVLAYVYGASSVTDAYLISQTIPSVIFALIGTGISTSYIPVYSNIYKKEGRRKADLFTSNIINLTMILSVIIVIIVFVFTGPIIRVFASGFEGATFNLAVKLTKIGIFSVIFSGVFYILTGYLQVRDKFFASALMGIPLNLILIISILISKYFNNLFLSIGNVLAVIFQLLFLVPFIRKEGYKYHSILNIKDKHVINFLRLSIPVILGVSVNQINLLVDRTLASRIVIGGIAALNYANRLNLFIQGIFVMAVVTVTFPMLSKMIANNNSNRFKIILSKSIEAINLLLIPILVGTMFFSNHIVKLLFQRGAFNEKSISLTSSALFYYSIGMLGYGLREVLSRAFYSMKDTKTPMINAAFGMGLNIILNIILSKFMGIDGLALATSFAAIFTTGLMFISLRKEIGSFGLKKIFISFLKISFASIVMGLIAKQFFSLLVVNKLTQNLALIMAIGLGAISYVLIIYFMKIDSVDAFINTINVKMRDIKIFNDEK
jgi:putative peptidoglycan lipid II flippase